MTDEMVNKALIPDMGSFGLGWGESEDNDRAHLVLWSVVLFAFEQEPSRLIRTILKEPNSISRITSIGMKQLSSPIRGISIFSLTMRLARLSQTGHGSSTKAILYSVISPITFTAVMGS